MKKLNVLVVDDTHTTRLLLAHAINNEPDMQVVGEASDGVQAVKLARQLTPDVILMDIVMPKMDGLQATREIMHTTPCPIVLISASFEPQETDIAFQAIKAGALTLLQKPTGLQSATHITEMSMMLNTLRTMSQVKVIHHWQKPEKVPAVPVGVPANLPAVQPELVAVVSSTGGPGALSEIIRQLPSDFSVPVVIVQHIAPDFVVSLTAWLKSVTPLAVEVAKEGDTPRPGRIYLAPGDAHLKLNGLKTFVYDRERGKMRHMPSGDLLLSSVAKAYRSSAVGIVLTGMGDDGARGLREMYDAGAFTIAQDKETSVVFGMPQEAIRLGAAHLVLPLNAIGQTIIELTK